MSMPTAALAASRVAVTVLAVVWTVPSTAPRVMREVDMVILLARVMGLFPTGAQHQIG